MNGCIYRTRSDLCMKFTTDKSISFCVGKKCPDRKESNADRIRSMTDEELAGWLLSQGCKAHSTDEWCKKQRNCQECWLEWLQAESGDSDV